MANKDGLVGMTDMQEHPRDVTPSDFTAPGGKKAGFQEGKDSLVKQSPNQVGPRHTQDGGGDSPAEWGKDGEFKIGMSTGEGGEAAKSVKTMNSVSLTEGTHDGRI